VEGQIANEINRQISQ